MKVTSNTKITTNRLIIEDGPSAKTRYSYGYRFIVRYVEVTTQDDIIEVQIAGSDKNGAYRRVDYTAVEVEEGNIPVWLKGVLRDANIYV